jgi:hypothetical protein
MKIYFMKSKIIKIILPTGIITEAYLRSDV